VEWDLAILTKVQQGSKRNLWAGFLSGQLANCTSETIKMGPLLILECFFISLVHGGVV
jgi:hypothetical protein